MTKRHKRKYAISRRLGVSLWGGAKDPVLKRNYPPGMHGSAGYKKQTDYGEQLLAKQKLKKYYGDVSERQFRNTYVEADRRKGDTSQNFVALLESRLSAFVYRAGFAPTVFAARQLVSHKHVLVNSKVVNISSYRLKVGDVVTLKEKARNFTVVQESLATPGREEVSYIQFNERDCSAVYSFLPTQKDIPYPVEMHLHFVVEYYSR